MNCSIANRVIALGLETETLLDHSGGCAAEPAVPVILQIVPALETGGAERTTIDIARALKETGWTALVATRGGWLAPELARGRRRAGPDARGFEEPADDLVECGGSCD